MSKVDFKLVDGYRHIRYEQETYDLDEMIRRSKNYLELMNKRRSVRDFSDKPVPLELIENIIKTASTAPSGAHKQPWTFCVIGNKELKNKIRIAAEEEEQKSYDSRMSDSWLKDLKAMGTNPKKAFIEKAPYLIIVFKKPYDIDENGEKHQNYYVNESVGLACGILISAIHNAGLATLTHTPSPMRFLEKILNRPSNERAFLLLPVGYVFKKVYVPDLIRKPLEGVMELY